MKTKLLSGFIFAFFINYCLSQSFTIEYLNMKHGLSNDYVIDIEGDKDGYLWFATDEGLNRYDGHKVVNFYHTDDYSINQLSGNELNKILDDPIDKILWIATKRSGLSAYDYSKNQFKTYRTGSNHSISSQAVTDIEIALDGNLWIATYNKGIDYFNKKNNRFKPYNTKTVKNLVSDFVWNVVDDKKGKLYVGHKDSGLSIIDIETKTAVNYKHNPNDDSSLPSNDVRCVYQDKYGNIWIGTDKGLSLFNPNKGSFINFGKIEAALSSWVTDIAHFSDNCLWVSTKFNGIIKIDLSQPFLFDLSDIKITQLKNKKESNNLSSLDVRSLYQDKFGHIWAGTWGSGANFITKKLDTFTTLSFPSNNFNNQSKVNEILSISKNQDDDVWIGTYSSGIYKLKNNKVDDHITKNKTELTTNTIQAIHCDQNNNMWFGVLQGGVFLYNSNTKSIKQLFPNNLNNIDVTAICQTKNGHVLIGTTNSGIYLFDSNSYKLIKKLKINEKLIKTIAIDKYENIIIGTYGIGMKSYSKNMELKHSFHGATGFISNVINHIYIDNDDHIWVATSNGLVEFDDKFIIQQNNYEKKNQNIKAVVEDGLGNIWYSTNKGINCIENTSKNIFEYNHKNYTIPSSFSSGSVIKTIEDFLYFGSLHGVCFFNPKNILVKKNIPKPFFSLLNVYTSKKGKLQKKTQSYITGKTTIELEHIQNNFNISFSTKDFSLKNKVQYSYMLEGLSKAWSPVSEINEISFRDLPPGNYKLHLRSSIRNQNSSSNKTSLEIVINPPLWLTWWAKLIYFIFGIIIIVSIIYYREHKLKIEHLYNSEKQKHKQELDLNDERLRFYTNITHELRTPLTLILGPIEDMLKSASLKDNDKKRLSLIHKNTLRLQNLVNKLLDFRKTETLNNHLIVCKSNIVSVVKDIGLRYKELNRNPNVTIDIKTTHNNIPLIFDKEVITMVLDNLISNAIKYTNEGKITISISKITKNNHPYIKLKVEDTGLGIDEEDLPKIFELYYQKAKQQKHDGTGIGLALAKNLILLHEGSIQAKSTVNKGTSFTILLSEINTYPNASYIDEIEKEDTIINYKISDFEDDNYKIDDTIVLVVDDNKDICEYIKNELSPNYEVLIANNGEEGLKIALKSIPDIIISDVMMPKMGGLQLCEELKKNILTSHIPVILLTVKDTSLNKEDGYKAGADSYLTKPFSSSLLKSRLKNLLIQRKMLAKKYEKENNHPLNNITNAHLPSSIKNLTGLDAEFIEKITKIIIDDISSEKIDIKFLSEKMFISSSTLYRKMKAITNLSTNEFIKKIKMKEAAKLIQEQKYTLTEISYMVGINSQVYFRKCFKEEFGCTPSKYLKSKI